MYTKRPISLKAKFIL